MSTLEAKKNARRSKSLFITLVASAASVYFASLSPQKQEIVVNLNDYYDEILAHGKGLTTKSIEELALSVVCLQGLAEDVAASLQACENRQDNYGALGDHERTMVMTTLEVQKALIDVYATRVVDAMKEKVAKGF